MLDLQPRNDKVDEVEHQEDGEEGVGLSADCVFAFGNDALVEPARRDVEVDEEVDGDEEKQVEHVLDDQQVVKPAQSHQFLFAQRLILGIVGEGGADEEVFEFLIEGVDEIEGDNDAVSDHDECLKEESEDHVLGELGDCEYFSEGFPVVLGLELHHVVEEEDVEQDHHLHHRQQRVEVLPRLQPPL